MLNKSNWDHGCHHNHDHTRWSWPKHCLVHEISSLQHPQATITSTVKWCVLSMFFCIFYIFFIHFFVCFFPSQPRTHNPIMSTIYHCVNSPNDALDMLFGPTVCFSFIFLILFILNFFCLFFFILEPNNAYNPQLCQWPKWHIRMCCLGLWYVFYYCFCSIYSFDSFFCSLFLFIFFCSLVVVLYIMYSTDNTIQAFNVAINEESQWALETARRSEIPTKNG